MVALLFCFFSFFLLWICAKYFEPVVGQSKKMRLGGYQVVFKRRTLVVFVFCVGAIARFHGTCRPYVIRRCYQRRSSHPVAVGHSAPARSRSIFQQFRSKTGILVAPSSWAFHMSGCVHSRLAVTSSRKYSTGSHTNQYQSLSAWLAVWWIGLYK
jgi:hypothetical protein